MRHTGSRPLSGMGVFWMTLWFCLGSPSNALALLWVQGNYFMI